MSFALASLFVRVRARSRTPPARAPPSALPRQVCIKTLTEMASTLSKEDKKDLLKIESRVGAYCEKPANEKETKLCYYIDPIKRMISQPIKNGVPIDVVCSRLKKESAEICALKYTAAATVVIKRDTDLSKLKVKDLKAFIMEKQISCSACNEKDDFAAAITRYFQANPEL